MRDVQGLARISKDELRWIGGMVVIPDQPRSKAYAYGEAPYPEWARLDGEGLSVRADFAVLYRYRLWGEIRSKYGEEAAQAAMKHAEATGYGLYPPPYRGQ